ncbi:MAG: hypothetical protein WCN98_00365 [Verrucomicrobiaceae bacterium]
MKIAMLSRSHSLFLGLALASMMQGGNSVAAAAPVVISDGLSPAFQAVASHLELGGCSYEYSEAGGMEVLAEFMDEVIKAMPAAERKDLPPDFSLVKFFKMLGMDSVTATGSSSRQRADGSFHSRSFAYVPQGRKGLMTLSGGPAAKWLLHETAPKDTDIALEFSINLKDFAHKTLPQFMGFMAAPERAKFDKQMNTPDPATGLSGKQIMEKLDARMGVFLRLDPTKKFQPAPDAPVFPGVDGVIVLDHLGWMMEALKPQLMQAFSQPHAPATVSMEGGMFFIRFNAPAGPPPMDYQPVLRFDPKADRILIASRPALFDSVANGRDKITDGADFARTWRDLPAEGNACIYASTRFMQTLGKMMEEAALSSAAKTSTTSTQEAFIIQKLFAVIKPLLSRGQAMAFANLPDGMMTSSNTSIVLGSSSMQTISTVAILASLAVPAFVKVQEKGNETKEMSRMKQVVICLKLYAADHDGNYPAQLSELTKDGITDDARLLDFVNPATHEHQAWIYNNNLTDSSDGRALLLAAPVSSKNGKRLAAFNDGSVRSITEAEFQQMTK